MSYSQISYAVSRMPAMSTPTHRMVTSVPKFAGHPIETRVVFQQTIATFLHSRKLSARFIKDEPEEYRGVPRDQAGDLDTLFLSLHSQSIDIHLYRHSQRVWPKHTLDKYRSAVHSEGFL